MEMVVRIKKKAVTMVMVVNIKSALLNTTNTRQIFTMAFEFNFESMVRGYHVYKDVWDATIGETLPCEVESGNASDPYAARADKRPRP